MNKYMNKMAEYDSMLKVLWWNNNKQLIFENIELFLD